MTTTPLENAPEEEVGPLDSGLKFEDVKDHGADAGLEDPGVFDAGTPSSTYTLIRATQPNRTIVLDANAEWAATFTDGARTVTFAGPPRSFSEASTTATVHTRVWARLIFAPYDGSDPTTMLASLRKDTDPNDLLGTAAQYLAHAPAVFNSDGTQIAGDADYGPLQADGTRQEGSDFNDYLGVSWTYADGTVDAPETAQFRSLDCSGFVRMIFGFRHGMPLSLSPTGNGAALPRRAVQMDADAPGVWMTAPNLSMLAAGDLVFFDASTDDGTAIDHVGIYLGQDSEGHYRFVSSRKSANGPTLGDLKGSSILDGTGLYARTFRSARRL